MFRKKYIYNIFDIVMLINWFIYLFRFEEDDEDMYDPGKE